MSEPAGVLKREWPGSWWPLGDEGKKQFGRLTVSPTNDVRLVLESVENGAVERSLISHFHRAGRPLEARTFHGFDQDAKPVTLFGCLQINAHSTTSYSEITYDVPLVLRGFHSSAPEDIRFSRVRVDFAYLQEWLVSERPALTMGGPRQQIITFPESEERLSQSGVGFTVGLASVWNESFGKAGLHFNSRDHLTLHFDEPWTFKEIQDLVIELQWLLTLAVGAPVPVTELLGFLGDRHATGSAAMPIEVLARWPGRRTIQRDPQGAEMLFTVRSLTQGIGPTLACWRTYRIKHDAVLSSYFATVFNEHLYQNHIFLFLAHALELYHQIHFDGAYTPANEFRARIDKIVAAVPDEAKWLQDRLANANMKTLADRLRELVKAKSHFLENLIGDTEEFVGSVKNTRHYYTHFDEQLLKKGKVADGGELVALAQTMRTFLETVFLDDLGLSEAVRAVVRRDRPTYIKGP